MVGRIRREERAKEEEGGGEAGFIACWGRGGREFGLGRGVAKKRTIIVSVTRLLENSLGAATATAAAATSS